MVPATNIISMFMGGAKGFGSCFVMHRRTLVLLQRKARSIDTQREVSEII